MRYYPAHTPHFYHKTCQNDDTFQKINRTSPHAKSRPNLLSQDFTAQRANKQWVADLTYLATAQGERLARAPRGGLAHRGGSHHCPRAFLHSSSASFAIFMHAPLVM